MLYSFSTSQPSDAHVLPAEPVLQQKWAVRSGEKPGVRLLPCLQETSTRPERPRGLAPGRHGNFLGGWECMTVKPKETKYGTGALQVGFDLWA